MATIGGGVMSKTIEDIISVLLVAIIVLSISFALILIPINYHFKDKYKAQLLMRCCNEVECMQVILGKDNKFGY